MKCIVFLFPWRGSIDRPCGGIQGKILSIASELARRELFEPLLVTTSKECTLARQFAGLGFKVYSARMDSPLGVKAALDIERILRKHDVALLQSHTFRASLLGRLVRRAHPDTKHVFRVHTHIEGNDTPHWRKRAYHWLDRWTQKWVDSFVPISECIADELRTASGVVGDKITVVHNGILSPGEPDAPVPASQGPLNRECSIVGKIEERKQQHVAVQAVGKLRDKGLRLRLHLLGGADDGYLARVRGEAARLDVANLVVFGGYDPRPFERLKQVPVIILPSRFEGVPTSLIEGMSMRKLVIGTPTGGTAELIKHGVNGFLHRPGHVDGLVELLENIFLQPAAQWETMRDAAYAMWQNEFHTDLMMKGLIDTYMQLGVLST